MAARAGAEPTTLR